MGSLNKIMLIGNVGKDPEVRLSKSGDSMATFTMATSYGTKTDTGREQQTEWHRIVMWRMLAEQAEKYVRKGRKLYIEGRLQTRKYEQNGEQKSITEVVADRMEFLDSRPAEDSGDSAGTSNGYQKPAARRVSTSGDLSDLDDNPFADLDDLRGKF
ncbi:MAG: single-stranded DNA-binding protein [Actinobacteria bacterium]|nr:single-stranded DNA-binding protein [Actinomycetota bacterium]